MPRAFELSTAADLLGSAAAAGHPGALFRLALVALRSGKDWKDNAWFLVAEAARHGHGDAQWLLTTSAGRRPSPTGSAPSCEDTSFFEEMRLLLGVALPPLHPAPPCAPPAPGRQPETPDRRHATDIPSPTATPGSLSPTRHGPAPHPDSTPHRKRRHLTALPGGLSLSMPDT
ncbi:SEL1-like repeat protein [[Kitasatospora] papulosa]|uniref:sel1 repeat family protein n=1 Tax=[Kitasatospora] papulosa TaxID=1464011 RepID=UPI00117D6FF5